jgi:hypothetical protein
MMEPVVKVVDVVEECNPFFSFINTYFPFQSTFIG